MVKSAATSDRARAAILEMLAAENCCNAAEISGRDVRVFERHSRRLSDARCRRFTPPPLDVGLVSLGLGAVASASLEALPFIKDLFSGVDRDAMFDPYRLGVLAARLREAGQRLIGPVPRFVANAEEILPAGKTDGVDIENRRPWDVDDIRSRDWPHALMRRRGEQCPIQLVTVARTGDTVAGVATATADTHTLWQVGIDIAADAQGRGIGHCLASAITTAVLERGAVPYWCTNPANLRSIRTALSIGYKPMWLEVYTKLEPVELVPVAS